MALAQLQNLDDSWSSPQQPNAFDTPPQPGQPVSAMDSSWSGPAPSTSTSPSPSAPAPAPAPTSQPTASQPQASPAQQVMTTLGVSPQLNYPTSPAPAPTTAPTTDYQPTLSMLQAATDPQSYLNAQDQLGRQVYSALSAEGHDVSWTDSGQLLVDGRPYELGDGQGLAGPVIPDDPTQTPPEDPNDPRDPTPPPPTTPPPTTPTSSGPTTAPLGFDQTKWNDPNHTTDKYKAGHILAAGGTIDDVLAALGSRYKKYGDDTIVDTQTGDIIDVWFDFDNATGQRRPQWTITGNVNVPNGGGAPGGGGGLNGLDASWLDNFGSSHGSLYTPTAAPGMDPRLEALMQQLSEHPTSMDPHTVDMMEAADAEQQMEAAQSEDQQLQRFGAQTGYIDSPWLASERASTARSADQGILGNRRNIEISAAKTNNQDLRNSIATMTNVWQQSQNVYQLNEQLKLEAAKLGLTRDQFLAQMKERLIELELQDEQFGARLAFDYDKLNSDNYNNSGS